MADENVQTLEATEASSQPDFSAELAQQMNLSLSVGNPATLNNQAQDEQQSQETQVEADGNASATQQVNTPDDPFGFIKDKFGYQSHEDAIRDIEELRAFKEKPIVPNYDVPNDESGAILRALAAGKREEVWRLLDHDMRIERLVGADVSKENAADIVKMGMQIKYKDLTPDEINYKFNKQFSIPPEPKQMEDEEDTDYQNRLSDWKGQVADKQMELMIEAKLAKPELQNAKIKFDIPEIETPVDEGYAQYKQMLAQKTQDDEVNKQAYKALSPKSIETKLNFKDEANKIEFEYQFEPDVEGFSKAVAVACDAELFWQTFINSDGSPNRQKFLDAIYYANNKEKVLMSAMNQAKNATIKASLPDNTQNGLVRQIAQHQEPNELEQQMRNSLRGYGGY